MMIHIQDFVTGMTLDLFSTDIKTYFAVVRALEVIGEAAKQVPSEIRERHPDVPWKQMAGMRDHLIHGYFGIDANIAWETATKMIPDLLPLIENAVSEEEQKEKKGTESSDE
ncbi:DUF86 domain-containing protein [bacterium]|nr:DUF86 domain-containing protein [bacterium]